MTNNQCEICRRIELINQHQNPYFVKELSTGYVVLGDSQYFKGYTLFLCKKHVTELHFLPREYQDLFLHEMSLVSEAVANAFKADKMNCELLGNGDSHVHWHLFPRHTGDTPRPGPVWWVNPEVMYSLEAQPNSEQLQVLKMALQTSLDEVLSKYGGKL
ncbi:HIT family protein [Lactobacillus sp. ESL0731]|uniref:HIT family protein n=1 Tax=unclassified Lactobacillus TaxID=2620435 RepID=UPI0023F7F1A2|nr:MULTISPECIES: HIT family protein [unclassified Lactobacillus]WEV51839.1 HIT family protein [Lactobacillus sp. ESL0700]WEV62969.1 HIT family protein [Lactobacillus sp. ESL0731]